MNEGRNVATLLHPVIFLRWCVILSSAKVAGWQKSKIGVTVAGKGGGGYPPPASSRLKWI